ncbi:hypothetical protein GIB67_001743 [Kingdonia uniflora]|uniref:NAD(P)-binding domain-containing protein n=1 Tax=Kingdonia uniflora TaxID=39325 RepID=A0A7J7NW95_9MAGN|nr:hypothetical protein GIB67_001743 [Kingdonia uniflora]
MAPTLTSNSFLLTSTPPSKLTLKDPKPKGAPNIFIRLNNQDNGSPTNQNLSNKTSKFFDLKRISEVKSIIPIRPSTGGVLFGNLRRKDPRTVFVAGAIGQAGIRIAQMLLREGFTVRAGVPDLGQAQELAQLAANYKIISPEESKRLYAVESTFEDAESIAKAIANASKVVVTIGSTENGPTSEVTTTDALQVVQASQLAGVGHVAIIYDGADSLNESKDIFSDISSFFNNLFSRSRSLSLAELLEKVVMTDVKYTLIKTSLTEDFSAESSYNLVVSAEGSNGVNDFKVSKSQIASLVADVFSNTAVAENKVVEVSTDPSALSKKVDELFRQVLPIQYFVFFPNYSVIPEDGRRKAYAEALAQASAEEEAIKATEIAREAAEVAKKLEQEVKKLSDQEEVAGILAEEAQKKVKAAGASVEGLLDRAKDIGSEFSWEKLSSQISTAVVQKPIPKTQIATVRGKAKARTLPAKKAVTKRSVPGPTPVSTEPKKETRNIFGGLFKQETIYIDDE